MIPAMCARYPQCKYDKDMEVFVQDLHDHEFYKRGGATDRPDRDGLLSQGGTFQVIEPNEELRLELCKTFGYLLRGILATTREAEQPIARIGASTGSQWSCGCRIIRR